jgi:peptide deformylase
MKYKNISFTSIEKIPEGKDIPLEDLVDAYCLSSSIQSYCIKNKLIGAAATQFGFPINLFVLKKQTPVDDFETYFNCSYVHSSEQPIKSIETCPLLIENKNFRIFEVERYKCINVVGKRLIVADRNSFDSFFALDFQEEFFSETSIVFQKMIDYKFASKKTLEKIGKEIFLS